MSAAEQVRQGETRKPETSVMSAPRFRAASEKGSDTNGTNLGCLSEPRALAVGLRRILTTFSSPTASARGSKPVPFGSDTKNAKQPPGRSGFWFLPPFRPFPLFADRRYSRESLMKKSVLVWLGGGYFRIPMRWFRELCPAKCRS